MADFKLAGIVSAVGFGLGYLLSGRASQVMEAVQGEYGITYMEAHNDAKNQHKYYLLLTSGKDNYTAYGRLPGYGRDATMKLDKQPSASKMKELAMKKMKTYQLVGHKYDQIPSEIRAKLETAIGVKPSSPPAESKPQKEEPKKPVNARLAMAMKRRQMMGAEGKMSFDEKIKHLASYYGVGGLYIKRNYRKGDKLVEMLDDLGIPRGMVQEGRIKDEAIHQNKYKYLGVSDWNSSEKVVKAFIEQLRKEGKIISTRCAICKDQFPPMFLFKKIAPKTGEEITVCKGCKGFFGAEYQPDQEIGDYSVSEIAKSSAIEGYQPNKYSYGPIGYGAEMKLKKDSCCCGATKKHPCLCMIKGTKQCSAKSPMCPCYKEIAMGTKVEMEHTTSKEEAEKIAKEHLAEHPDYYSRLKSAGLDAETIIPRDFVCSVCDSSNLKIDVERNEVFCDDCGLVNEDLMQTVKRKPIRLSDRSKYGCWGFRPPIMDDPDFVKIDWIMNAESYEADERWYGLKLKHKGKLHRSMAWTYEDSDGTQIEIHGDGGGIKKEGITLGEAIEYLDKKGIPFDPLKSMLYHYNDEIVKFSHPKGKCYKHDWSEIMFHDYSYEDDGTGGILFEQRCRYCDVERKGNLRGKVAWDMNAESSDSIPKPNPADKEETFAWVKREHPHIKTEADKEMDEYNYAALTYHPEELESGAVNALKAGDLEAAQNFVKALNRQKFIKAFQAERNR